MKAVTRIFPCGPTLQAKVDLIIEDEGGEEQSDVETIVFGQKIKVKVYDFSGIQELYYDNNVGQGDPDWQPVEHGIDIGKLIREHKEMKAAERHYKSQITRLKNQLEALGVEKE